MDVLLLVDLRAGSFHKADGRPIGVIDDLMAIPTPDKEEKEEQYKGDHRFHFEAKYKCWKNK